MRSDKPRVGGIEVPLRALKFANILYGAPGHGPIRGWKICICRRHRGLLALIVMPPVAQSQGFPSKPIRIIVPYTPGSPNAVLARLLAQQLQGKLGQAVVVDNKPGGGTTIGSKTAAVAPPDGYTLLFASSALVIEPIMTKQVEYDPLKDFTPTAFVARTSSMLTVTAQVPANSPNEFVTYTKANPATLSPAFPQGPA